MTAIGFVGLGVMGRPMAGHMLEGMGPGSTLTLHDLGPERVQHLLDAGARWAGTPAELARAVDVIVAMVPDIPQIEQLLDGPDGLLAGVARPTVLVISSTVSPDGVRRLAERCGEASGGLLRVVDAPVSGGEVGAKAGRLSIMVGGSDADVAAVLPVLALTGTPVHLGPIGAGQVAKACNQLICAASLAAIAEASVVAERAGLDVGRLLELLQGGYAGSNILADKGPRYAAKDYAVSGAAKFWIKDLRAYLDEAERTGTATVQADRLLDVFVRLTERGWGDLDTAVVQRQIAEPD